MYKTEVLKSNLCDYNDAYILVEGDIPIIGRNLGTEVAFKNCALFIKFITKIDGTTIDDTEDLDLVMSEYNLLEYSSNYSDKTSSLWLYSKDEATNFNNDIVDTNDFKSFKYKTKLFGNTKCNGKSGILKNSAVPVSLKYLINFGRSSEMPLINCEVELTLKWTNRYVLSAIANDNDDGNSNNITFTTKDTRLYAPVVTLSAKDNQ